MGHTETLIDATATDSRDTWIAAYAGWYFHFLAMQPKEDRLALDWARRMTEAVLPELCQRLDRAEIQSLATQRRMQALASSPPATPIQPVADYQKPVATADTPKESEQQMSLF